MTMVRGRKRAAPLVLVVLLGFFLTPAMQANAVPNGTRWGHQVFSTFNGSFDEHFGDTGYTVYDAYGCSFVMNVFYIPPDFPSDIHGMEEAEMRVEFHQGVSGCPGLQFRFRYPANSWHQGPWRDYNANVAYGYHSYFWDPDTVPALSHGNTPLIDIRWDGIGMVSHAGDAWHLTEIIKQPSVTTTTQPPTTTTPPPPPTTTPPPPPCGDCCC